MGLNSTKYDNPPKKVKGFLWIYSKHPYMHYIHMYDTRDLKNLEINMSPDSVRNLIINLEKLDINSDIIIEHYNEANKTWHLTRNKMDLVNFGVIRYIIL